MTREGLGYGDTPMRKQDIALLVALALLLAGCNTKLTRETSSSPSIDQMPLALASPLFTAGYELAGYYDLDADSDGVKEALAVLTLRPPTADSFTGTSYILLFGQHGGAWSLNDTYKMDGTNASAELQDVTDDGSAELLVVTEEIDTQPGDFVTPLRHIDHLSVLTYTPAQSLTELGTFTSSLSGEMSPYSTVSQQEGQTVIQTAQDLPPVNSSLWRAYRVETFGWDGQRFVSLKTDEQRRISPIVSWLVRRNGPWVAVFLILGSAASAVATILERRSRLAARWLLPAAALLFIAAGISLGALQQWLCAPALILIGLTAFVVGRQILARSFVKTLSPEDNSVLGDEAESAPHVDSQSTQNYVTSDGG